MTSTDLWEFAMKCTGCGLRWILFGAEPDKTCAFCGSSLVKVKRRG